MPEEAPREGEAVVPPLAQIFLIPWNVLAPLLPMPPPTQRVVIDRGSLPRQVVLRPPNKYRQLTADNIPEIWSVLVNNILEPRRSIRPVTLDNEIAAAVGYIVTRAPLWTTDLSPHSAEESVQLLQHSGNALYTGRFGTDVLGYTEPAAAGGPMDYEGPVLFGWVRRVRRGHKVAKSVGVRPQALVGPEHRLVSPAQIVLPMQGYIILNIAHTRPDRKRTLWTAMDAGAYDMTLVPSTGQVAGWIMYGDQYIGLLGGRQIRNDPTSFELEYFFLS